MTPIGMTPRVPSFAALSPAKLSQKALPKAAFGTPPALRFQGEPSQPSIVEAIKAEQFPVNELKKLRQYAAGELGETPEADTVLDLVGHLVERYLTPVNEGINYHEKAFNLMKEVATQGLGPLQPDHPQLLKDVPAMMDAVIKRSNLYLNVDALLGYLQEYADGLGQVVPDQFQVDHLYGQLFDNCMGNRGYLNGRSKRDPDKALQVIRSYAKGGKLFAPFESSVANFTTRLVRQLNYWQANQAATAGYPDPKGGLKPIDIIREYGNGFDDSTPPDSSLVEYLMGTTVAAVKKAPGFHSDVMDTIESYAKGFKYVQPDADRVGQWVLDLVTANAWNAQPLIDRYVAGLGKVAAKGLYTQLMYEAKEADANERRGGI